MIKYAGKTNYCNFLRKLFSIVWVFHLSLTKAHLFSITILVCVCVSFILTVMDIKVSVMKKIIKTVIEYNCSDSFIAIISDKKSHTHYQKYWVFWPICDIVQKLQYF